MSFTKAPLGDVLKLYEVLTDRPVQASEQLRQRPVSMNTKAEIPRSEAVKFIESRLGNYGIRIVEQRGKLVALGPDKKADTPRSSEVLERPTLLYAETEGLSGEALKAKLHAIAAEHHKPLGYGPTKDALMAIDQDPANTNNVITLYERKSVPKANFGQGDPSLAWDREHVLPQSYGAADGRNAKSDLHNLFPTLREVNSLRSSLFFDESDETKEVPAKAPLASHDADSWEPPDEIKGDIARAIFYMDIRYDGSDSEKDIKIAELTDRKKGVFGKLRTLLDWDKRDPVSAEEEERNDEVYKMQGNRNPFVDSPDFAERVYCSVPSTDPIGWRDFVDTTGRIGYPSDRAEFDKNVLAAEDAVRNWPKLSRGDKMNFCERMHVVAQQEFCYDEKYSERIDKLTALERKTRPLVDLPEMTGGH